MSASIGMYRGKTDDAGNVDEHPQRVVSILLGHLIRSRSDRVLFEHVQFQSSQPIFFPIQTLQDELPRFVRLS